MNTTRILQIRIHTLWVLSPNGLPWMAVSSNSVSLRLKSFLLSRLCQKTVAVDSDILLSPPQLFTNEDGIKYIMISNRYSAAVCHDVIKSQKMAAIQRQSDFTRFPLAQKLFHIPKPNEFPPGKPSFPDFTTEETPLLFSLIGPRSLELFSLMVLSDSQTDWMQLPVKFWNLMGTIKWLNLLYVN